MRIGMKNVDGIVIVAKNVRVVLLAGSWLLFAGASVAQARSDPKNAMAPAQLQRAIFTSGLGLAAAKTADPKASSAAAPAKRAHKRIHVYGHPAIAGDPLISRGPAPPAPTDPAPNPHRTIDR